jgi:hypothetical protein
MYCSEIFHMFLLPPPLLLLLLPPLGTLQIVVLFIQLAVLGAAIGLAFGLITSFWLARIFNEACLEIILTFGAAYACYFVAEELCGASGLLAVVVMGFSMSVMGELTMMFSACCCSCFGARVSDVCLYNLKLVDVCMYVCLSFVARAVYACYFVAEELCGASGLLAVIEVGFSMQSLYVASACVRPAANRLGTWPPELWGFVAAAATAIHDGHINSSKFATRLPHQQWACCCRCCFGCACNMLQLLCCRRWSPTHEPHQGRDARVLGGAGVAGKHHPLRVGE